LSPRRTITLAKTLSDGELNPFFSGFPSNVFLFNDVDDTQFFSLITVISVNSITPVKKDRKPRIPETITPSPWQIAPSSRCDLGQLCCNDPAVL
jgi:hypothetical protein